jgi:hypothetical protein
LKSAITKYLSDVQEVFEKYVKIFKTGPPFILSLVRAGEDFIPLKQNALTPSQRVKAFTMNPSGQAFRTSPF